MRVKKVSIIILNYNAWADTIECLESVFRSDYPEWVTFVVDNASSDDSCARLRDWAEGKLDVWLPPDHPLRSLSH
ncbi:MAG: glycosyltransferase, partial [Calditrichaeota bacterium]